MIYFLLFSIIILFIISLIMSEKEVLSPAVIINAGFIVAVLAAICNIERWSLTIHWNTYWVIFGGLLIFTSVSILIRFFFKIRNGERKTVCKSLGYIAIENWKIYFLMALVIFISAIYLYYVRKIVGVYYGKLGWTETMYHFRHLVSYGQSDLRVPNSIEQLYQLITLSATVCIYILIYNYVFFRKIQKNLLLLTFVIICSSLLNTSRLNIIIYFVESVTFYDIFLNRKNGKGISLNIRFAIRAIIGFVLFCGIFVFLKQIAGRIDDRNPFYYITYYLGQSIHNLDVYLQEKHTKPDIWGKETFYGLNHALYLFTGDNKYNYIAHKEFRFNKGISTGNVYTTFRAFIHDFGYLGFILLTIIFSAIMNFWYLRIKTKTRIKKYKAFDISAMYYAYMMFTVYTAFFTDYFYNRVVSLNIFKTILSFYFWELLFVRVRLKMGEKNGRQIINYYTSI